MEKTEKQKSVSEEVIGFGRPCRSGVTSNVSILGLRRLFKHTILISASTIVILIFRSGSAYFGM